MLKQAKFHAVGLRQLYYLVSEEVPERSYLLSFLSEEQTKILIWRALITMDLPSGECLDFPPYSLNSLF